MFNIRQFIEESIRVLKLTKKPTKDEFMMVAKVTGIGMILIGLLGTLVTMIGNLLQKGMF